MTDLHALAAVFASAGNVAATGFYALSVLKNKTKPHLYTWLVWTLLLATGGAVALVEGAMWSALTFFVSAASCFLILLLSLRHGEKNVTRGDKLVLLSALAVIPVWRMADDALVAAILVTTIDFLGFVPTFRKSWHEPFEESLAVFAFYTLLSIAGVAAVNPLTLTTGLYPAMILVTNGGLTAMLLIRRKRKGAYHVL